MAPLKTTPTDRSGESIGWCPRAAEVEDRQAPVAEDGTPPRLDSLVSRSSTRQRREYDFNSSLRCQGIRVPNYSRNAAHRVCLCRSITFLKMRSSLLIIPGHAYVARFLGFGALPVRVWARKLVIPGTSLLLKLLPRPDVRGMASASLPGGATNSTGVPKPMAS